MIDSKSRATVVSASSSPPHWTSYHWKLNREDRLLRVFLLLGLNEKCGRQFKQSLADQALDILQATRRRNMKRQGCRGDLQRLNLDARLFLRVYLKCSGLDARQSLRSTFKRLTLGAIQSSSRQSNISLVLGARQGFRYNLKRFNLGALQRCRSKEEESQGNGVLYGHQGSLLRGRRWR